MSQDLEQYHEIIEQLKPMINEPEFNQVLIQVASAVPKQKRFLIKMELKRLARPCVRRIDLRGSVDGECREFEYDGTPHFLDDIAIDVFERQTRLFGEYTIGVYEAVINTENNFRVLQRKRQEEIEAANANRDENRSVTKRYMPRIIEFSDFAKRGEERMNYSVNIELFTELNKSIQASTIDISVSGLKIKVSKEQMFKPGERLSIQFRGLEGEYTLDKKNGIPFSVVNIDRSKDEQRLCLQRLYDFPAPAFDSFIERFIHGNKRRYKVNMSNTLKAIHNKTFEQYYTPNFTSLPVYIEKIDGTYSPKYVLANDSNKETAYFWGDEQHQMRLGYLFSHERIANCLSKPEGRQETFVYVFNHVKDDKIYFYSATQQELDANPELKPVFLGYGARKASWRIYKLQLTKVKPEQCYLPLSIPDSVGEAVRRQNQPPAPRLMARIKRLSHVALLTDITDLTSTLSYQKIRISRKQLAALRIFGHPRNKPPVNLGIFRFKYLNQRRESRFQLRTRVVVKCNEVLLDGVSEDISTNGMKVELNNYFHEDINAVVGLSFPQLQSVTQKYDLTELPYRVRHVSAERNVIHLHAVTNAMNTTAQTFFDELIKNNRSRLKAYRDEEEIPGIGEALRNIYTCNTINIAFFVRKDGVHFVPDAVATNNRINRLTSLLSFHADPGCLNLEVLYTSRATAEDFISYTLKKIKTNTQPVMREMFIAFDPSQVQSNDAIKCRFSDEFKDNQQRKDFIQHAIDQGQFIAIKIFLARTGRPDAESLKSELNYVGVYAVHKAKVLEEQLWNVTGVGDLLDVSDEAMQRYQFSPKQIEANHQAPTSNKSAKPQIEQLLKA